MTVCSEDVGVVRVIGVPVDLIWGVRVAGIDVGQAGSRAGGTVKPGSKVEAEPLEELSSSLGLGRVVAIGGGRCEVVVVRLRRKT